MRQIDMHLTLDSRLYFREFTVKGSMQNVLLITKIKFEHMPINSLNLSLFFLSSSLLLNFSGQLNNLHQIKKKFMRLIQRLISKNILKGDRDSKR